MTPVIFCQVWKEPGAGLQLRLAGYSLHLTPEDRLNYLVQETEKIHDSRYPFIACPSGGYYPCRVSPRTYQELQRFKSLRFCHTPFPEMIGEVK